MADTVLKIKKKKTLEMHIEFFLVGKRAHCCEGDRRVLLGDNRTAAASQVPVC
jgi:hypothetical protein